MVLLRVPSTVQARRHWLTNFTPSCKKYTSTIMTEYKPKLIVFDLDFTLWPFWVDTHVSPPFHMNNGKVYDARKNEVKHYPDVPEILRKLHKDGYQLGIASRTGATQEANDLTRLYNWDQFFHYRQIYTGCKITHFKKLHNLSGVAYDDMIFFDDEQRNIHDVSSLGVTCKFVPDNGVSWKSFQEGIDAFQKNRASKEGGHVTLTGDPPTPPTPPPVPSEEKAWKS